nr:MAG TPA: hypothetical protein [Caudoviricetes sp.]
MICALIHGRYYSWDIPRVVSTYMFIFLYN